MDKVLRLGYGLNRFTKLQKFSKPIQTLFLLFPLVLQGQIPDSCISQWDDLPYQSDSAIFQSFPDFLACCGTACQAQKDSLLGRVFHLKAIVQWQENDFRGAVSTNQKALIIRQKASPLNLTDIGHSHLNLGIIFTHHLHRYQQARRQLDTAWQYLEKGANYELRGDCMHERAIIMQKQGDFDQSFLFIDMAIENYEKLPAEEQPFLIANEILAKGELYTDLRDYPRASQAYHKALSMFDEMGALFDKAKVLHDLGHLKMEQKHWEPGYSFFQQSLQVYQQLSDEYKDLPEALAYIKEQKLKSQIGLGSCLIQLRNYVRAEKELISAMKTAHTDQVNFKASIADNLGDLYQFWGGKNDRAFLYFNTGLSSLFPAFSAKGPLDCPKLTEESRFQGEADLLLTLVQDKAKALRKAANSLPEAKKTAYLESALQHYLLADQLTFRFRQNQQAEASRLFWQQENRALYEAAIDLCYELNEPKEAFQLMENSKALVLLESLKDAVAKASAGISEDDLQTEQQLKGDIAQLAARIAGLAAGPEKETLQKRLDELTVEQSELKEAFRNRYPQYFTYKYGQWTKSHKDIQEALGEAGLIEYFEGKTSLYLSYLSKDTLIFSKMEKQNEVVEAFMGAVKNPLLNRAMAQAGYQLYQQLFQPLSDITLPEKLYIVPDGRLTQIPFDALCHSPVLVASRPAFLLHEHHISYAYSASVLFQKTVEGNISAKKLLAIAPGTFEELNLPPLPHSEPEAKSIVKTMGGNTLLGDAATKSAFLAQSKDYLLLHLSTHAAADSIGSPWIAFKDSFLYLPAIYGLETQAKLVVLSACQTSQGKLAVGEGVMSLARAFRYAGVPSVLASMWEAEDASAKFIMEVFYEKLKAGLPKDEALSEAKRAYLAEDAHYSFRSPFFWSNFVLVGDVGKLEKFGRNEIRLMLGLFLTLLIYFYFRTKNRKKHASPH